MYLQGGGSIRFAAGFVAGVLLREAAMRKAKRPPRSLLVPAGRDDANDGPMLLVRQLEADDVDKGFLELLGQLTSVATTREAFLARLAEIRAGPEHVYVVEENGRLIAGHLLLERKFARSCGICGHVEDIVVDASARTRHGAGHRPRAHARRRAHGRVQGDPRLLREQPAILREVRAHQEGGADGEVFSRPMIGGRASGGTKIGARDVSR